MEHENLLRKIYDLSDVELALLLSLLAREHCLISTPTTELPELVEELQLCATRTFGLRPVVVPCHSRTTVEDFNAALLVAASSPHPSGHVRRSPTDSRLKSEQRHRLHVPPLSPLTMTTTAPTELSAASHIANVVIARDLDRAPRLVQIQALELLRTRRIFTRTAIYAVPKQFLFVAVVSSDSKVVEEAGTRRVVAAQRLVPHLNDLLYLGHWHDPEDGFANIEEVEQSEVEEGKEEREVERTAQSFRSGADEGQRHGWSDNNSWDAESAASSESVLKTSYGQTTADAPAPSRSGGFTTEERDSPNDAVPPAIITTAEISTLAHLAEQVRVDVDVLRYQMNIVSFLRMHRAVAGGVTPTATKHFERLARSLAPLHGLDFVTPALVALAARKVYLHRILLTAPEKERSMQWGSDLAAIEAVLEGVGPEEVIEDVLEAVTVPV
ncbi:hypothetical protein VTK73DRAFT_8119 [Phialemonium thermophilum]|uniref:magnesium chelatase n=1 Tax=Phialemonium thermophilum TaxID=223376 RepID=A0ABR3XR27_9PEZI